MQNLYLEVSGTFKVAAKVAPAAIWSVLQFPLVAINTIKMCGQETILGMELSKLQ